MRAEKCNVKATEYGGEKPAVFSGFFMSDDSDTNPMLSLANETKNDRELFPKKSIVKKYLLIMLYNKDFYPEI